MRSFPPADRFVRLGLIAACVVLGLPAAPAQAHDGFSFTRLAGNDRYDTARAVAEATFDTADTAVVARGDAFPDALAGSYLAGAKQSPVVLTGQDSVPVATLRALSDMQVKNVVLLGGPAAITPAVETKLAATPSTNSAGGNLTVTRIGGQTRYETARLVAEQPGAAAVGSVGQKKTAIIASGATFPDALAGGPLAFGSKLPLLITDPASLSSDAQTALGSLAIKQVVLLGGTAAVSPNVESQIKTMQISVVRLAGADRTQTAERIADYAIGSLAFDTDHVNLARGDAFADALAGGPHGGKERAPLMLTAGPNTIGTSAPDWLRGWSATLSTGHVLGGPAAVTDAVATSATEAASAGGPVTITTPTVPQGGHIDGTVADPSALTSIGVSGCGLTIASLTVDPTGRFSLTVPTTQPAAECHLTFVMTRIGGSNASQQVPVTVTVAHQPTTAAPDLVSASLNPDGTVTYLFDAAVVLPQSPTAAAAFHAYRVDGTQVNATQVAVDGAKVVATFGGAEDASQAVLVTVEDGAVEDAAQRKGPECGVALRELFGPSGSTDAPDLVKVVVQQSGGDSTADFTFDDPIALPTLMPSKFELIGQLGTTYLASQPAGLSLDMKTVTMTFTGVAAASIVRGAVQSGAVGVQSTVPPPTNPRQSAPVANGGKIDGPNLVGVQRDLSNVNTVDFTYDRPLSSALAAKMYLFDEHDVETAAMTADFDATGKVVRAHFPNGVVTNAVGASVDDNAIKDGEVGNRLESAALPSVVHQAGTTDLPDLVSVDVHTVDAAQVVTFTFDGSFPSAMVPAAGSFHLYDADANPFTPAAMGTFGFNRKSVDFTVGADGAFSPEVVAAAVVGAVNDSSQMSPAIPGAEYAPDSGGVKFPEGCAAVGTG